MTSATCPRCGADGCDTCGWWTAWPDAPTWEQVGSARWRVRHGGQIYTAYAAPHTWGVRWVLLRGVSGPELWAGPSISRRGAPPRRQIERALAALVGAA